MVCCIYLILCRFDLLFVSKKCNRNHGSVVAPSFSSLRDMAKSAAQFHELDAQSEQQRPTKTAPSLRSNDGQTGKRSRTRMRLEAPLGHNAYRPVCIACYACYSISNFYSMSQNAVASHCILFDTQHLITRC